MLREAAVFPNRLTRQRDDVALQAEARNDVRRTANICAYRIGVSRYADTAIRKAGQGDLNIWCRWIQPVPSGDYQSWR